MHSAATRESPSPPSARIVSVDVLRGLTIALMILVNDPGDWTHTYSQLDHAAWNGFTLTDFVFPNFLFLVGVSIILSLQSRIARSPAGVLDPTTRRTLALRIVRRAALIFAIKMFLTAFPHFHLTHLRIFGVLTRIAACYLAVALVCLFAPRRRALLSAAAVLLVGYWILMRFVHVPGLGTPVRDFPLLDPDRNLAAWLDRGFNSVTQRWLHTGVLYNRTRDPEGLLSTLPAIATTLIGAIAAQTLLRGSRQTARLNPSPMQAIVTGRSTPAASPAVNAPDRAPLTLFLVAGMLSLAAGLLWNHWFPINKNLWTSSYVLFAAGWSLLLFAGCYWLFDVCRIHKTPLGRVLTWPWLVFGSNAITAFVLSNFVVEVLLAIYLVNPADPARPTNAWTWPYRHLFAAHGSTPNTSLAFALTYTMLCLIPNWLLWRRKVFLRL